MSSLAVRGEYPLWMINEIKNGELRTVQVKPARLAYNLSESAAQLGISESSVRRLVQRGRLRRVSGFRHILIPASELERLVN